MGESALFDARASIQLLSQQSGIDETIIAQRIQEKITKFSGLLTEQGALVLVSKELNIRLPSETKPGHTLKLGELKPGMNNVDVNARIKYMDRPKPFSKNGKEGKYISARLEDETGEALYTFWNEQADEAIQKGARPGSTISLQNARVGVFNNMTQLSLGYNGTYRIDTNGAPSSDDRMPDGPRHSTTSPISFAQLGENQFVHTRAHVLDILPGKGYYVKCTACGGKIQTRTTDCPMCGAHGKVETRLLVSMLLDDGSKPIRGVAFENEALALYGKSKEELLTAMEDPTAKDHLNRDACGKIVEVQGKGKLGMDRTSVELLINRIIRVPFENA